MDYTNLIWAAVALGCGLLIGEIAGRLLRSALGSSGSASFRENAPTIARLVFWASTAVGLVLAIAVIDDAALEELGQRLDDNLPSYLIAFLTVIAGYAVSVVVAAMVGQSARKATGIRQRGLERALQAAILATAIVVALTELGVESSMLVVLLIVVVGTPALAVAMLSAFGGREVAMQLAAGRALRHQLRAGRRIVCGDVAGRIVVVHATAVELEDDDGTRHHLPNRTLLDRGFCVDE